MVGVMRIGDIVWCWPFGSPGVSEKEIGLVVGFNQKGEGGKEFVHVLCKGTILIFMDFDICEVGK
tara:strand:+ start:534 stop:728 length:195 start_codon:yes stop_codon:yes gene_type:complete